MNKSVSRREFLQGLGLAAAGAAAAACQPQTVVVEKEVTKIVEKIVEKVVEKPVEAGPIKLTVMTDWNSGPRK